MADFTEILTLLNKLRLKRKGQNLINIAELATKTYNWTEDKTVEELEKAEKENVIKKWTVNNRTSYRSTKEVVRIVDNTDSCATQTEQDNMDYGDFQSDFIDFKKHVFQELSFLKSSCKYSSPTPEINHDSFVVHCLKNHISSLERQLADKQKTIDSLLGAKNILPHIEIGNKSLNDDFKNSTNKTSTEKSKSPVKNKLNIYDRKITNDQKNVIIGDSMLIGLVEKGFKENKVSIKAHSGASTDDIYHYIKPEINKSPDVIIIHGGTNDLSKNIKTVDNFKMIHDYLKVHSPSTRLAISALTTRKDIQGFDNKVTESNSRLKKFCVKNDIDFISNNNIDDSCLSTKKLHLNKKGNSYLANNFINYLNYLKD